MVAELKRLCDTQNEHYWIPAAGRESGGAGAVWADHHSVSGAQHVLAMHGLAARLQGTYLVNSDYSHLPPSILCLGAD